MYFVRQIALGIFSAITLAVALPNLAIRQSTSGSATVDLANGLGEPQRSAAAIHNGIPPNDYADYLSGNPPSTVGVQATIPHPFIDGLKLTNARGGQGNLPAPSRGWLYSVEEYTNRFRAVQSNWETLRSYGGNFTLMVNNLFSQRNDSSPFPGENGDWTVWDAFIERLCSDINSNDMTEGLDVEIWNEPDLQFTDQELWRQVWGRGFHQLKSCLPSTVRVVGPGIATLPSPSESVWTDWLQFVKNNDSVPDTWTFHELLQGNDPEKVHPIFLSLLKQYDLPERPIYVNEYGYPSEQKPSYDAWFISKFERLGIHGGRANWESGLQTADLLANTLVKSDDGEYEPNGSWWVMSYCANMTGTRVDTSASADGDFSVFATSDGSGPGSTKILAASHGSTDAYCYQRLGVTRLSVLREHYRSGPRVPMGRYRYSCGCTRGRRKRQLLDKR